MLLLLWHVKSRGSRFPKVAETLFSVESRPWVLCSAVMIKTVFVMISQLCIDRGQLTATSRVFQNQVQDTYPHLVRAVRQLGTTPRFLSATRMKRVSRHVVNT